jgi:hypothetical protein
VAQALHSAPPWASLARRLRRLTGAALCVVALAATAAEPNIVVRELAPATYPAARDALEDALAAEGLAPASVSGFGAMLARTAPDLGHRPDLYREAEIFSFCSAQVAARMAAEDVRHIALCPLTVALYTLPGEATRVRLAYRRPGLESPGGRLADALLARIAARTAAGLGLR